MTITRTRRIGKRHPAYRKTRRSRRIPFKSAQTQGLGGLFSGIAKIPKILQMVWQMAPVLKMFMGSFSGSNQAALPGLPFGNSEREPEPEREGNSLDEENQQDYEEDASAPRKRKRKRRRTGSKKPTKRVR